MKERSRIGGRPNAWQHLEDKAEELLRLVPNARVFRETFVAGKKVDLISHFELPLRFHIRAVVECKAFNRPLTRLEIAKIVTDYQPVLESPEVNCLFIITNRGISPAAATLIDHKRLFHYRIDELSFLVMGTGNLIYNMIEQFHVDGLSDEFVQPRLREGETKVFARYAPQHIVRLRGASLPKLRNTQTWMDLISDDSLDRQRRPRPISTRKSSKHLPLLWDVIRAWILDANSEEHLALLGSYGIGKSSFARFVANRQALLHQENATERIPLLLRLREFSSHLTIDSFVSSELATTHNVTNPSFTRFTALNRMGRFLLILDGFDEMKTRASLLELKLAFEELSKLYVPHSKILSLGRPSLFSDEQEMALILEGRFPSVSGVKMPHHMLIGISPMTKTQITELIAKRGSRVITYGNPGYVHYQDLRRLLATNKASKSTELELLLSRPVHVQMLLSILPTWEGDFLQLNRCKLYESFVVLSVQREIQRLPRSVQPTLSAEQRIRFSGLLAVEMLERGGSLSIRVQDISDRVVLPFMEVFDSSEAVRRDLLLASFLELSARDGLYFAHKSYGEYLAAREICHILSKPEGARLPTVRVFNAEVCSFLREMINSADVPYYDAALTDGRLEVEQELLPVLASCFANPALIDYWLGRLKSGQSPIALHVVPHFLDNNRRSEIGRLVLTGVREGSSQYCLECASLVKSGFLGAKVDKQIFKQLLEHGEDEVLRLCLSSYSTNATICRQSDLVDIIGRRLVLAVSDNAWNRASLILNAMRALIEKEILTLEHLTYATIMISNVRGLSDSPEINVKSAAVALLESLRDRRHWKQSLDRIVTTPTDAEPQA